MLLMELAPLTLGALSLSHLGKQKKELKKKIPVLGSTPSDYTKAVPGNDTAHG